jgi:hypothetical protein
MVSAGIHDGMVLSISYILIVMLMAPLTYWDLIPANVMTESALFWVWERYLLRCCKPAGRFPRD